MDRYNNTNNSFEKLKNLSDLFKINEEYTHGALSEIREKKNTLEKIRKTINVID